MRAGILYTVNPVLRTVLGMEMVTSKYLLNGEDVPGLAAF